MKFTVAELLSLFLSVLAPISALDLLPNHAPPEILAVPPNVTIMTPRVRNSGLEKQISDFGILADVLPGTASVPTILAAAVPEGAVWLASGVMTRVVVQRGSNVARAEAAARAATGYECYRDSAGDPKCRDPDPLQEPDSSTRIIVIQTTQVITQIYQVTQTPLPTQTQLQTRESQASGSSSSRTTSCATATHTGATRNSETKANVAAIAGGAAAGVVSVVLLILATIIWHRQKAKIAATRAKHAYPSVPPNADQHGAIPLTPGSSASFLRPTDQHQNLSVPHFNGVPAHGSPVPAAPSGPYNASHYSVLPEPQLNAMNGPAMPAPVPRCDSSRPHPLPMTIEHIKHPQTPIARPGSGHTRPSSANPVPYAEHNISQSSGWTTPADNEWESPPQAMNGSPPHANQPSADAGARRLLSMLYKPSSHVVHSLSRSPSRSPALPEAHDNMAAGGNGGGDGELPVGAPPLMDAALHARRPYVYD
ncbi:hypothetical protein FRC06_001508 [Ceratobasidium sp. 370]|nr:hypothetical protein FRC06_001508 [Ceratobasidium sp. 370]